MYEYVIGVVFAWALFKLFYNHLEVAVQTVHWWRNPKYQRLREQYQLLQDDYATLSEAYKELKSFLESKFSKKTTHTFGRTNQQIELEEVLALYQSNLQKYEELAYNRAMAPLDV